jgi:para-aminobenzoate synthetase component 1
MEMDELSLQKVPYFFVIDFLSEKVEIYQEHEIENSGLIIDFQHFSTIKEQPELNKKVEWKSFPETRKTLKPVLIKFRKIFVLEIPTW